MNILLIQPNATDAASKDYLSLQFPINLGYIASALKTAGHTISMIDLNVQHCRLEDILAQTSAQVVGVTAMTSAIENAGKIISEVKRLAPKVVTMLGGIHASALPEQTLREMPDLDYVVFGEGELTMVELLQVLEQGGDPAGLAGVAARGADGAIVLGPKRALIEDLDSVAFPLRTLIPFESYNKRHSSRGVSRKDNKVLEIITTRGCPNDCIFCAGHVNYGRSTRFRSPENVIAEITEAIQLLGINHISIVDDTFTLKRKSVAQLCEFFAAHKLTWDCNARVNTVDYEMLKMMADSGCFKISFGVESGSPEMLKKIKKKITVEQVKTAVKAAKKARIRFVECTFMIGAHVDETLADVAASKKLLFEIMPDFMAFSIMCPLPGTEIRSIMQERGLLSLQPNWSDYVLFGNHKRYDRITHMSSDQMWEIQEAVTKKYYGSPRYILSQVVQIRSWNEVRYFLKLGVEFVKEFF